MLVPPSFEVGKPAVAPTTEAVAAMQRLFQQR